ncbi:MAG: hypothetical protein ACRC1H_16290 [Caldilineaceae bacterium]
MGERGGEGGGIMGWVGVGTSFVKMAGVIAAVALATWGLNSWMARRRRIKRLNPRVALPAA